ncbi:MAG: large repetitive protein, partial [Thermoleophilaceae bacterium]|nr:large repetitive protein [Thermoleophilaceae bacterium]
MLRAGGLSRFRQFYVVALLAAATMAAAAPAATGRSLPDLRVDRLTLPAAPVAPLGKFTVSERTGNHGRARAGRSSTGYYLSRDSRRGADVRLGRRSVGSLAAGRSSGAGKTLRLPSGTPAGRYRVIACADDLKQVRQSRRGNDCRVSAGVLRVEPGPQPGPGPLPLPQPQPQPAPGEPDAVAVTIDTPAEGASTNAAGVAISGHAAPGAFVTVSVASGGAEASSLQALPAADGSWSVSAPGLGDGAYAATASQTDGFGRTQASGQRAFRVDRTSPTVTLTDPADGSTTPDTSPTADGALGTAPGDSPGVTLKLYRGATAAGPATLTLPVSGSGGAWTVEVDSDLGAGTYTLQAEQTDSAGNVGKSAPSTFQIDDTGPTVTLANPVNGARTNDATPALDGTAGSAAAGNGAVSVKVYNGADTTGTLRQTVPGTLAADGSWTAVAATLPQGVYTAQASQPDGVGNTGLSAPHTFTVDTTKPALAVTSPAAPTNDTTPVIAGTAGTATGDLPAVTITLSNGVGTVQTLNATAAADGSWQVSPTTLPEGTYTADATQSDSAGNVQTTSRMFAVDTTGPAVTVAAPTAGTTPTFSGTAGTATGDLAQITAKVYSGPSATGTPVDTLTTTASSGSWSVAEPSTLSEGQYTVVAQQSDSAGNTTTSSPRTFTIDVTGPAVNLVNPADNSFGRDTTPTFTGTAEDTTTVTVKVYNGSGTGGSLARTLTVTPSGGNWSV